MYLLTIWVCKWNYYSHSYRLLFKEIRLSNCKGKRQVDWTPVGILVTRQMARKSQLVSKDLSATTLGVILHGTILKSKKSWICAKELYKNTLILHGLWRTTQPLEQRLDATKKIVNNLHGKPKRKLSLLLILTMSPLLQLDQSV